MLSGINGYKVGMPLEAAAATVKSNLTPDVKLAQLKEHTVDDRAGGKFTLLFENYCLHVCMVSLMCRLPRRSNN